jgi:CheY-like chemotaxis protein
MRRTILLADDSPTIRRLVTQTFADGNFEIVEVSNGEAAIKALEEVRPSVVLADIYMPGKNGYEVCAYVRNHPRLHATPVVLLVGAFDAFDEETAKQAGATANITKPFEPGVLIELVKSILSAGDESRRAPDPEPEPARAHEPEVELQLPPPPPVVKQPAGIVRPAAPPPPPQPARGAQPAAPPAAAAGATSTDDDLLGLEIIFKDESSAAAAAVQGASVSITEDDIDRIADRVIQRISTQVIESIAWDVVPDITEKIVREELKRIDES